MEHIATGIFRQELPQQFLHVMSKAGWEYIKHIYEKVIDRYKDRNDKHFDKVFVACLSTVKSWGPRTKYEELGTLKKRYPYVGKLYEASYLSALQEYCRVLKQKEFRKNKFTIPVFDDFFVLFLGKISDEKYVQDLTILQYTFDQLMYLFSTLLRSALLECIQFISIPALKDGSKELVRHSPYEQDVQSIMSLSEANLKWHNQVQALNEREYNKDRQEIAESVILPSPSVKSRRSQKYRQKQTSPKSDDSKTSHRSHKSLVSHKSNSSHKSNRSHGSHRSEKSHKLIKQSSTQDHTDTKGSPHTKKLSPVIIREERPPSTDSSDSTSISSADLDSPPPIPDLESVRSKE